jgi:hypothetical protein
MEKKECLECHDPLSGRIDKKFCSDYCRNSFNNKLNKDGKNLIRNINNRLRKNWRILETLNPNGSGTVSKKKLEMMGFDFNYITEVDTTKVEELYYLCYDQGYSVLENEMYKLEKKD